MNLLVQIRSQVYLTLLEADSRHRLTARFTNRLFHLTQVTQVTCYSASPVNRKYPLAVGIFYSGGGIFIVAITLLEMHCAKYSREYTSYFAEEVRFELTVRLLRLLFSRQVR